MTDLVVPAEGVTLRGLRRSEYEQLAELGVFGDEKVELLGGEVIAMSPQGILHASAITWLTSLLAPLMLRGYHVRVQLPLAVDDVSLPEPDIAVVDPIGYQAYPSTAHLVIEVAMTTQKLDLVHKAARYATAGVTQYVVVDLQSERLVVHHDPTPDGYGVVEEANRFSVLGETITLAQVLGR